ncbi:MAG: peptidase [Bacteroidetes bacterium]|nr:peptidase [Bacteroidota bacterium]
MSSDINYIEDFNYFWQTINDDYCYFDKKQTNWNKVKEIYSPLIEKVKSREEFISILENVFDEIYDNHASLNTNTGNSPRLVPSGTDFMGEFIDDKPILVDIKREVWNSNPDLKTGMEIIVVNDVPIEETIKNYIGKSLKVIDDDAKNYALNKVLAGRRGSKRKLILKLNGEVRSFLFDEYKTEDKKEMVEYNINDGVGYIKINNCLFDNDVIKYFDEAMELMRNTKSVIIDLRDTPSGGNTTVARAILGWFVSEDKFYQKHELTAEEIATGIKRSWMEIVSPRKGKCYSKPTYVLAGRWTGSVGEGITIGFDAIKSGVIIGTKLAGLCGAIYSFEMPDSKIRFSFPVEKLFHVNGTLREKFIPEVEFDFKRLSGNEDVILNEAIKIINNK